MPAYSSTQPLHNPLSQPINWRFAVALAAVSESSGASSDEGHRNPNSPIYHDAGCYLFDSCLTCPLPSGKAASNPSGLRKSRLLQMHHPLVAPHNGRGIGDR